MNTSINPEKNIGLVKHTSNNPIKKFIKNIFKKKKIYKKADCLYDNNISNDTISKRNIYGYPVE